MNQKLLKRMLAIGICAQLFSFLIHSGTLLADDFQEKNSNLFKGAELLPSDSVDPLGLDHALVLLMPLNWTNACKSLSYLKIATKDYAESYQKLSDNEKIRLSKVAIKQGSPFWIPSALDDEINTLGEICAAGWWGKRKARFIESSRRVKMITQTVIEFSKESTSLAPSTTIK